jgi:hypothetical protein
MHYLVKVHPSILLASLNGTRMALMTSPSMFLVVFNVLPPWKVTSFLSPLKMVSYRP